MTQTQTEEFPLNNLQEAIRNTWNEHRRKIGKPVVRIASFNLLVVSSGETDPELAALVFVVALGVAGGRHAGTAQPWRGLRGQV